MGTNKMLVDERQREIGSFLVGRLLPFRKKRSVGPFVFIDHMGPMVVGPKDFVDVDRHPHIGLCTLTYLFEGSMEHTDSMGAHQIIRPGDVNFMTSGKGVTHAERTPEEYRDGNMHRMHGYQIWVALPKELEEMEPRFDHIAADDIPVFNEDGLRLKVVAGSAFGVLSPLKGYSPMFMVDVEAQDDTVLDLRGKIKGEVAFVIVKGSIVDEGEEVQAGQMLISKSDDECEITLKSGTQLLMFGGEPFPEERFLLWNFVSSRKDRLEQAKQDWIVDNFPKIDGDDTYVPFPGL